MKEIINDNLFLVVNVISNNRIQLIFKLLKRIIEGDLWQIQKMKNINMKIIFIRLVIHQELLNDCFVKKILQNFCGTNKIHRFTQS